jgi:FimV-like protein
MEAETLQLFDDYAGNRLSTEKLKEFEMRLEADQEFKKEFDEYIQIVNGIKEFERERLKEIMKDRKIRFINREPRNKIIYRAVAAAAIILILLVPAYIVYRTTTFTTRLTAEFYIKDPGLPVTMGASNNQLLGKAMIEYKDGNFQKSLDILNKLLVQNPANDTLNYYAGICNYELNNNTKAAEQFLRISSNESVFYFPSKYDLGLVYIKNRDFEKAKNVLNEVASGNSGTMKDKAEKLIGKL